MNSSDTDTGDEPGPDPRLGEWLRSLPAPATPASLESRVWTRIHRRRIARTTLACGSALTLVVAVRAWQVWLLPGEAPGPVVRHAPPPPPVAQSPSREIAPDELAVLFAPPPVDSLAIVGSRNEGWVVALNRLGGMK